MPETTAAPQIQLVQYPGIDRSKTMSPPCGKVHMTLRFKGLDYTIHNCTTPAEVKRYNPRGRVPVLLVDGETIVDSTDILAAIERLRPEPSLLPDDPIDRARVKVLEDWADEVLYFYGVYIRWIVPENFARMKASILSRLPAPVRWIVPTIAIREVTRRTRGQGVGLKDRDTVQREVGECLDTLDVLAGVSPFLVGDRMTRADIAVAAVVDQFRLEAITPELAAEVDRRRAVIQWLDRVHETAPSAAG